MIKSKIFNLQKNIPSWLAPHQIYNKTAFASVKVTASTGPNQSAPWLELICCEGYTNKETHRTTSRETMVTLTKQEMIQLRDLINEVLENKVTE